MKQRSVLLSTLIAAAVGTAYAGDKADGSAASADKSHLGTSIQASPTSEIDKQKEAYPTGADRAPLSGSGTSSAGTPSSAGASSDTMHTPPSGTADAPTSGVAAQKEAYPGRVQPSSGDASTSGASSMGASGGVSDTGASGAAAGSATSGADSVPARKEAYPTGQAAPPAVSESTSVTGSTSSSGTAAALGATTSATPLTRAEVQAEGTAAMREGLFPHGDPLLTDDRPKGGPIGADEPMNLRGAVSRPRTGTSDQVN